MIRLESERELEQIPVSLGRAAHGQLLAMLRTCEVENVPLCLQCCGGMRCAHAAGLGASTSQRRCMVAVMTAVMRIMCVRQFRSRGKQWRGIQFQCLRRRALRLTEEPLRDGTGGRT